MTIRDLISLLSELARTHGDDTVITSLSWETRGMGHEVVMQTIVYTTNDRIIGPWEITVTFPSEIVNPRALDMLAALIHSEEEE
jgi:hypothetical protein